MVYFTKSNGTRLVEVLALRVAYPYYGSLETIPAEAGINFREGQQALVDKTLMLQYKAKVGDTIQVAKLIFDSWYTHAGAWTNRYFHHYCSARLYSFPLSRSNGASPKRKQV